MSEIGCVSKCGAEKGANGGQAGEGSKSAVIIGEVDEGKAKDRRKIGTRMRSGAPGLATGERNVERKSPFGESDIARLLSPQKFAFSVHD
jgi:hypothetical protein